MEKNVTHDPTGIIYSFSDSIKTQNFPDLDYSVIFECPSVQLQSICM